MTTKILSYQRNIHLQKDNFYFVVAFIKVGLSLIKAKQGEA